MLVHLLILIVLITIFWQDIRTRAVQWFWFPAVAILFFINRLAENQGWQSILTGTGINFLLLLVQLLLVSVYFSWRNKRWVNLAEGWLGWGDILLLLALGAGLSVPLFLIFYIASLLLIVLGWSVYLLLQRKKESTVPLAGLQALLCAGLLGYYWLHGSSAINADDWLLLLWKK